MTPVIIGASVQGESHIRHAVEKQDSYRVVDGTYSGDAANGDPEGLPEDVRILSVADGHGSAACPYSRIGSQTAVDVFCECMEALAVQYRDDMPSLLAALHREGETTKLSQQIVREWGERILRIHEGSNRGVPHDDEGNTDTEAILKQYGTTLLGMMITDSFSFAWQLGDGDITCVDGSSVSPVIEGDRILGVETHSISKPDSWKKVHTRVILPGNDGQEAYLYALSTDGWRNSHASDEEFSKTCRDYYQMLREHGAAVVEKNLPAWLAETSALGCGDDITTVFAYYGETETGEGGLRNEG